MCTPNSGQNSSPLTTKLPKAKNHCTSFHFHIRPLETFEVQQHTAGIGVVTSILLGGPLRNRVICSACRFPHYDGPCARRRQLRVALWRILQRKVLGGCVGRFSPSRGKSTPPTSRIHGSFQRAHGKMDNNARRGLFSEYHLLINCVICMTQRGASSLASHYVDRVHFGENADAGRVNQYHCSPFMWDINYSTRQANKKNS